MSSKITLQCVKEKSKLRIKFHSFTDTEGKVYTNVYNNALNCKFPKDIRKEGFFTKSAPMICHLCPDPVQRLFTKFARSQSK